MRYKEYNKNKVLEKCIPLFWNKGFNGTSVNEIVEATGVNRFSLYHEFENKEGILYNVLKLYKERYSQTKFKLLQKDAELEAILLEFFLSFLQNEDAFQGCFYIHIGTELADNDLEIKALIKEYLSDLENLFIDCLQKFSHTKEHASFYARHLIGLFCTSMSFCLIHTEQQKVDYIQNGINVILNKKVDYATST